MTLGNFLAKFPNVFPDILNIRKGIKVDHLAEGFNLANLKETLFSGPVSPLCANSEQNTSHHTSYISNSCQF